MTSTPIRSYAAPDETQLIALWNRTMWADPIDGLAWRGTWLLDPHFEADLCLVATGEAAIVGFAFAMTDHAADPSAAWLIGLGVDASCRRRGIGGDLLETLSARLAERGIATLHVGPYIPSYLTPGVDVAAYPDAISFFAARGGPQTSISISMKASLTGYRAIDTVEPTAERLADDGVSIGPPAAGDILPVLQFLDSDFAHWKPDATGILRDVFAGNPGDVTFHVAKRGDQVIGFAQSRRERFGPFGVSESCRGQGVGAVLLSRTLCAMRARGFHAAWFLWTGERAAKLYHEHGFDEVRRFAMIDLPIDLEM